jgi:hypothetical protein
MYFETQSKNKSIEIPTLLAKNRTFFVPLASPQAGCASEIFAGKLA